MAAAQSRKTRSRGAIWRARGNSAESVVVVAEITAAGGRAIAVQADLADPKAAPALFDAAEAGFGGVDVLVNNAGIMRLAPIGQADDALSTLRSRSIWAACSAACARRRTGFATVGAS
jgi:NAD(P)-dependent dehydrogenase (short-subunit alcohol dehydrogenase family)